MVGPLRQVQRQPVLRLQRAAVVQLRGGQRQVLPLHPAGVGQLCRAQRQLSARQQLPAALVVQQGAALHRQPAAALYLPAVADRRAAQRHRPAEQRRPGGVLQLLIQRDVQLPGAGNAALIAQARGTQRHVLRLQVSGLVYRRRTQAERAVAPHLAARLTHIGAGQLDVAVVQPQQRAQVAQPVRGQRQPARLPQPLVQQRAGGETAGAAAQQPSAGLIGDSVTELRVKAAQRGQRPAVVELPPAQRRHALRGQLPQVGQAGGLQLQPALPQQRAVVGQ
ncbi:hypothetical protein FGLHLNJM_03846 [Dickeya solani]|nr:hypothetical protein FGLHLNJM_03846 [Dickeya solani]